MDDFKKFKICLILLIFSLGLHVIVYTNSVDEDSYRATVSTDTLNESYTIGLDKGYYHGNPDEYNWNVEVMNGSSEYIRTHSNEPTAIYNIAYAQGYVKGYELRNTNNITDIRQ